MKTPEEIKKGLECCYGHAERRFCEECPLGAKVEGYSEVICTDFDSVGEGALAYIRQLEEELEQVKRAATDDLMKALRRGDGAMFCDFCKHCDEDRNCDDPCYPYAPEKSRWEWRGVKSDAE